MTLPGRSVAYSLIALVLGAFSSQALTAQTPVALPATMTTIAGGLLTTSFTKGTTVCPGSTTITTSAYGDNCPAVAASFGAGGRGGVAVDAFGNVFVMDDINKVLHMIDATTGVMTVVAGAGTACSAKLDTMGDGCLAATQTTFSTSGPRGMSVDPYGNVLVAGYGSYAITMICRNASPLCSAGTPSPTAANPIQVQVGYMGIVAGCAGGTGSAASSGFGVDGTPGFSTVNTTNTASYPTTLSGSASAFKNTGSCTTSLGETAQPRGATADIYGNVYYADTYSSRNRVVLGPLTSSYFNGNNPMYAALQAGGHWTSSTLKPGYVYSLTNVAGNAGTVTSPTFTTGTTPPSTTGSSCLASVSGVGGVTYTYGGAAKALDIRGDGCPFFDSSIDASSGYTNAIAADAAGNVVFTDPGNGNSVYGGLRVLFVQGWPSISVAATAGVTGSTATAGVAMYNAIVNNNAGTTPTAGFVYSLAGGAGMQSSPTGTALSTTPVLGNNAKMADSSITKLTISPQGNIYIGDNASVLFYDIYNGTIRTLLKAGTSPTLAGLRCNGGTTGATSKSAFGDGCPVTGTTSYAAFGNSNGLGVAVDGQGNLYMYDAVGNPSGMLVRKVLAQGTGSESQGTLAALSTVTTAYPLQALGTAQTQNIAVHFLSATAASATVTNSTNADFSFATPVCIWNSTVDNSLDCTVAVTYAPSKVGAQTAAITLTAAGGAATTLNLSGSVAGSVLAIDGATSGGATLQTTAQLFGGYTPLAVAVDGANNVYAVVSAGSSYSILESLAGSASSAQVVASGLTSKPTSLAVDQTGNLYYLNGASTIQELVVTNAGGLSSYSPTTISYTPNGLVTANPVALAIDAVGNLLVADSQSGVNTLYKISISAVSELTPATCNYASTISSPVQPTLCQSTVSGVVASALAPLTFGAVNALTVDPFGNIWVADATSDAVYKLTPSVSSGFYAYTKNSALSNISASALAMDAAGDAYVESSTGVTMYPLSGSTTAGVPIVTAVSEPNGIAVDGVGTVYVSDASNTYVTQVQRGAITENFASNYSLAFAALLTNVGSQMSAIQNATNGANAGAFLLAGASSSGCTFNNNLLASMTPGQNCGMTAYFPAVGTLNATYTDTIAFSPNVPATTTSGALVLTGIADQVGYGTTTTIGSPSVTSPPYAPIGTEVSFPITVTAKGTSTDGSTTITAGPTTSQYVSISIDSGAVTTYNFTATAGLSASLTLNLSGLTAGTHSFTVNFPQQGSFLPSMATSPIITVVKVTPALTWAPSATTQQVSAAIGTGVLNAAVSPSVAGNFAYAIGGGPSCNATSAAGTTPIDASTYLNIGTYALYVTFCPTDTTDYIGSSTSISNYTVTQATTTIAVGASTMVVAPSGANYSSLPAALAALPVTGGTIYIAPGTYPTGGGVISYPNVQLRGLGGDPTQVVLTGANGDFSATGYPSGFNGLGIAGKGSDEGSATLDVSKNAFIGTQATADNVTYTPNNFYAENLTIQNTYDTDATTTTTWTATSNGGTCSNGSTAQTLQYLYNNNQLCGAQALALYLNSDGAILNNVNLMGQQDTLYASSIGCGTYCTVAREYMWKGLITGDVDYTFGDAALVFDHTNFFTTWHGLTATGQETITAQNKRYPTGVTNSTNSSAPTSTDYLSGFICNACTLMSQSTGMTGLYYGRPYDISTSSYPSSYSTWIMLNSSVDQVNPKGWIGWDGASEYLNTATYGEFNTLTYTDPTPGTLPYPYSLFNSTPSLLYNADSGNSTSASLLPVGGNTGSYGVNSFSSTPASREPSALALTASTAAPYYPLAFLSTTVPGTKLSVGQSPNWNPIAALAAQVNSFVPISSAGAVTLGSSITVLGRPQTPGAGMIPTGSYALYDNLGTNQVCAAPSGGCSLLASGQLDASGEAYLTTSSLPSGTHYITMTYGGDSNFTASTSSVYSILVLNAGQAATTTTLSVANTSSTIGSTISGTVTVAPAAAAGTISIYLDGSVATTCTLSAGTCSWSISGPSLGLHSMFASFPANSSYGPSTSSNVGLYVTVPVATGDPRGVPEPSFPPVCRPLTAALVTDGSTQDLDASVDATTSNIDGPRIQAALNACSTTAVAAHTTLAVELSTDATGTNNAFLSGPLSMPSNVTLLVDPNVTLYFSRNVQDYDKAAGTHTCGTINASSATASCLPLIDIPQTSQNVGIMGFGKLNGRGNDALLNTFATAGYAMPASPTWWNLSAQANGEGNQQNPRFIQMDTGSSNITLYKITILNSPLFHVSTTGAVNNFTAWDIKIVTPTAARNTDGIDPGNVQNVTIANSWISDGDDNVAVGAAGTTAPASNISVVNNHFYAGHGESIGSYTGAGVSNVLFDNNMSVGNAFAGFGSAVTANGSFGSGSIADTNSTAIRIKTANDRGGLVTGIQYSNSCFLDHKADIQLTPYYSNGDTTEIPSFNNILMQNLVFLNDASSSGTVELTGEFNSSVNGGGPVTNPLGITMDNVTFPSAFSSLVNSLAPVYGTADWGAGNYSGGTGQYTALTYGPGNVSSNFLTAYNSLIATPANNDTLTNNLKLSALDPPACVFTFLAPELTGPNGVPQSVPYGSTANLDVILTPAVGGAAYPTGTVTLSDAMTGNTFSATLTGSGDTLVVPIPAADLTTGVHTFSANYLGDSTYTVPAKYQTFGSYQVTVVRATPQITWNPVTSITYGTTLNGLLNASASVAGAFTFTAAPTAGSAAVVTNSTVLPHATYTLTATFAPTDTVNYTAATAQVTLQVNPATLTVTANNLSKAVGAINPTLTASISGFVNGDTSAVVSGTPALATTATASSIAGSYPITASVGTLSAANYTFAFVNGTLTVSAPPTPVINTSSTLTKTTGGYQASVKLSNSGTGTATNLILTTATLGSVSGSPLPSAAVTLAPGGSTTLVINFPASAGSDGATVVEKLSGTYTGGTFTSSLRAQLP